jgi:hypothetical protein
LRASALIALFLGAHTAITQTEDQRSAVIRTATGYLVVCNEPNNWFTLEIPGRDVRQTSSTRRVFNVDGMLLQIVTASRNKFLNEKEKPTPDEKTILQAHRDWEVKYSQESYNEELDIESSWQKLASGKNALLWKFNVPESAKSDVKKEIYLTLLKGDYVLMLGGIVTNDIKEDATVNLLISTASSLKSSDKPIDLHQLQESIRKGK